MLDACGPGGAVGFRVLLLGRWVSSVGSRTPRAWYFNLAVGFAALCQAMKAKQVVEAWLGNIGPLPLFQEPAAVQRRCPPTELLGLNSLVQSWKEATGPACRGLRASAGAWIASGPIRHNPFGTDVGFPLFLKRRRPAGTSSPPAEQFGNPVIL